MVYKVVLLFILLQWLQPMDVSSAPDAALKSQEIATIEACCPAPWPCFPGEAMCAESAPELTGL